MLSIWSFRFVQSEILSGRFASEVLASVIYDSAQQEVVPTSPKHHPWIMVATFMGLRKTRANFVIPSSHHEREKVLKGRLFVDGFIEKQIYSFLDYISSRFELIFMVAIDFTVEYQLIYLQFSRNEKCKAANQRAKQMLQKMEPPSSKEKEMDFKIQRTFILGGLQPKDPYFIPQRGIVFVEVDKDHTGFAFRSEILGVVMVAGAQASSCEEMASTMTGAESSVLKGLQQCIDIVIAEVDRLLSTEQKPLDYRSADNSIMPDHRRTVACTSSPEVHSNTAETLCAITRNTSSPLASKLSTSSFVSRIFGHALDDLHSKFGLVSSLSFTYQLVRVSRHGGNIASPAILRRGTSPAMRPPIATVTAVYSTSISVDEVSGDEVSVSSSSSARPPFSSRNFGEIS
ncbi:hypothetical protein L1887_44429 [Cichorium endivia]|nr:hypothetical protein L1887_44429 [Cichorium endivia]